MAKSFFANSYEFTSHANVFYTEPLVVQLERANKYQLQNNASIPETLDSESWEVICLNQESSSSCNEKASDLQPKSLDGSAAEGMNRCDDSVTCTNHCCYFCHYSDPSVMLHALLDADSDSHVMSSNIVYAYAHCQCVCAFSPRKIGEKRTDYDSVHTNSLHTIAMSPRDLCRKHACNATVNKANLPIVSIEENVNWQQIPRRCSCSQPYAVLTRPLNNTSINTLVQQSLKPSHTASRKELSSQFSSMQSSESQSLRSYNDAFPSPLLGAVNSPTLAFMHTAPCKSSEKRMAVKYCKAKDSPSQPRGKESKVMTTTVQNRTPQKKVPKTGSGASPVLMSPSILSTLSDGTICRICHEGESKETLLSPCQCTGTMGMLHVTCLEQWLGSANTSKCEICNYQYTVQRSAKSFSEWLHDPSSPNDRRNFVCDAICFSVLTPLAGISAWLCLLGAHHYSQWPDRWEVPGLISLTVFLMSIYFIWCMVAFRYHYRIWNEWKEKNHTVRICETKHPGPTAMSNVSSTVQNETDFNMDANNISVVVDDNNNNTNNTFALNIGRYKRLPVWDKETNEPCVKCSGTAAINHDHVLLASSTTCRDSVASYQKALSSQCRLAMIPDNSPGYSNCSIRPLISHDMSSIDEDPLSFSPSACSYSGSTRSQSFDNSSTQRLLSREKSSRHRKSLPFVSSTPAYDPEFTYCLCEYCGAASTTNQHHNRVPSSIAPPNIALTKVIMSGKPYNEIETSQDSVFLETSEAPILSSKQWNLLKETCV